MAFKAMEGESKIKLIRKRRKTPKTDRHTKTRIESDILFDIISMSHVHL